MPVLLRLIFGILLPVATVINLVNYVITKQNYYLVFFVLNAICTVHNALYFENVEKKDETDDEPK